MSISKAQAAALAEGFLDNIGTDDRSGIQAKDTLTEVVLIAAELVVDAQDNLNESNSNASGKLSASLTIDEPYEDGGTVHTTIRMNFYGRFVNKGVKGTQSGSSTAGYSFKNPFPNRKMAAALKSYIARAKRSTVNVNKAKTTFKQEQKNASLAEISSAYALARTIKVKGIEPTGFLDKAIDTARNKIADRLEKAFVADIINSIKPM